MSDESDEIVGSLIRTRNAEPDQTIVLLEGSTDWRFWTEFKANDCEIYPPIGKENAIDAVKTIHEQGLEVNGVVAIVDPDTWLIDKSKLVDLENSIYYDLPDLELMTLRSRALNKVLRHTTDERDSLPLADSLRMQALELAMQFGYYRLLDSRHRKYNLSFNQVCFADVVDPVGIQIDHELVAEKLTTYSSLNKWQLLTLKDDLQEEVDPTVDLCRGKDTLSILAYLLRSRSDLSEKAKIQTKSNELSRTLRIAYEFVTLAETTMYRRIRDWESTNEPYRILRNFPEETA